MEPINKKPKIERNAQNPNNAMSHESAQVEIRTPEAENPADLTFNALPTEMIVKIFGYLTNNQIGKISRVCKRWKECAEVPSLWKTVDVNFLWRDGSQTEVTTLFIEKLSSLTRYIKIDFKELDLELALICEWTTRLNFRKLCITLNQKCANLHTLILFHTFFTISVPTMLNLCSEFLQNLKTFKIYASKFIEDSYEVEYSVVQIETFEVSLSLNVDFTCMLSFNNMPNLKKLYLTGTHVKNSWFFEESDLKFLHYLELLHLGYTHISSQSFRKLTNHCTNLTELFLCWTALNDEDFSFNNPVFPKLKTICLRECHYLTCEGIISLIQSCKSVENVYVNSNVARAYAEHPFVIANQSKLGIVKGFECSLCESFYKERQLLVD